MLRTIAFAATCAAAIGLVALPVAAQPVFDNMKCYKIRDSAPGRLYTADLVPKLTHDFATELGDRIVGGVLQRGCRIRTPAKFFCIEVEAENAHDAIPPYNPTQWTVAGPEPGERLCYKLSCPAVPAKDLAIIDAFGTRTIKLLGRTGYFCTSVTRQLPQGTECSLAGNGQCGGECPAGERCLATSPADCGCVPEAQACAASTVCSAGFCGGVWETCVTLPIGGGGCSHPSRRRPELQLGSGEDGVGCGACGTHGRGVAAG